MDALAFTPSADLSIGVELELQLVRAHDRDLAHDAADLLSRLGKRKLPGAIKPEITESMIELNSGIHTDWSALCAELEVLRAGVVEEGGVLNLGISGGGAHPFHNWADRRVFPTERFKQVLERYGYLAKQFTVFGQHIHIGCPDGNDAVYLVHMLTRYVPHFIALSAASPFYQGEDTTFQSSRLTAVNAFPLAGHMPFVLGWAAFVEYFEAMRRFGVVESMKDFYWDIRPKPEYGTVEIRVCDTPLTVRRAALLAAYAQALARRFLFDRSRQPLPAIYMVNSFNRFEASRFGYRGALVDPFDRRRRTIGEDILDTIAALTPHAMALGSLPALTELAEGVRAGQSDADWMRGRFTATGSLVDVVRESCDRWDCGRR
jgi:carboxylate-amine ligase